MFLLNLFDKELKKHLGLGPLSYLIYSRYLLKGRSYRLQATSCKLMSGKPSSSLKPAAWSAANERGLVAQVVRALH